MATTPSRDSGDAPGVEAPHRITRGAWMALTAALLGWMFDGFEMGLFPLVARPALSDLLGPSGAPKVGLWIGIMTAVFLVGAATGGVVFGWLGDRIGRVRAMTLSVLAYTLFMGMCGLAGVWEWSFGQFTLGGHVVELKFGALQQLFVFRFLASLGMGGEWSLGVALVMEIWPNRSRGFLAGLIGAASNVGFLTVALLGLGLGKVIGGTQSLLLSAGLPQAWVDFVIFDSNGEPTGWRLLMLLGAVPALLTFFIRLMVPESERWLHAKEQGATSSWAARDLLGVAIGAIGPLTMIYLWAVNFPMPVRIIGSIAGLCLALGGYTFPVVRYLQRAIKTSPANAPPWGATLGRMLMGACLSGVALIGTWASLQNAAPWADQLVDRSMPDATPEVRAAARSEARSATQIVAAIGAIIGTIGAALLGNAIGRRITYVILCVSSLASSLVFFQLNTSFGPMFLATAFLAGALTASFYGWLPLYLPELFRTSVRATGQGFSFNFGRILAAVAALQGGYLMSNVFDNNFPQACSIMSSVYLVGVVIIWFMPETHGKPLPD
jgi:SHS family sialic acid transporter-like MFS transporter